MSGNEREYSDSEKELKSVGLKATAPRMRILELFQRAHDAGAHHDHIVCTRCGRVEEFVDKEIEKRQKQIAARLGFELEGHSLSLYGVCADCQKKEKERQK